MCHVGNRQQDPLDFGVQVIVFGLSGIFLSAEFATLVFARFTLRIVFGFSYRFGNGIGLSIQVLHLL